MHACARVCAHVDVWQLYASWGDVRRYETVTRKRYKDAMLAPLKWLVPALLRNDYVAYLDIAGVTHEKAVRGPWRRGREGCA